MHNNGTVCIKNCTTPYICFNKNTVIIRGLSNITNFRVIIDGSRAGSGTGSGIYGMRPNRSCSFPFGIYATVFQTKIYAILECACENIRRGYKHK
jgi:hypothetical protein